MILKKLVVANGSYTNKDGVEKTRWVNIGALHQKDDGKQFVTIDRHINLAGFQKKDPLETRVFAQLFDPEKKEYTPGADW